MAGPLEGIKVVDLSIALTGPWPSAIMADQGAAVIKIEAPGIGDIGRWVGVAIKGISAMFQVVNRGKRSIALNLREAEAQEIARRLIADADVLVQNFRPGVMERLGLDYESVKREDLIYVSISGFGEDGPYAAKSAYDNVMQAYSGLAASQSEDGDQPSFLKQVVCDKITGLTAAQAITAALFARERGAGGQHVRLSMLEASVSFLWCDAAGNEVLMGSDGSLPSSFIAALKPFQFKDGWGTCSPVSDANFHGMCRVFGVSGADDPRVATLGERRQNVEAAAELMERVYEAATRMTTREAIAQLEAEDVPCGIALRSDELPDDPHVKAIGMLEESDHPVVGRVRQPRHPNQFERTPAKTGGPSPALGQHTDEVLGELGMADRVSELRERGVVA